MTPQESELVNALFDRLARLESAPRDAGAERLIADGLQRAPHAVYALVQTALVQDEALKRANARIEELQARANEAEPAPEQPPSFLDSMRNALGGGAPTHGSVPSVRPPAPGSQSQNFQPQGYEPQPGYPPPLSPAEYPGGPQAGSGGSFLGNAASTAAGVIGGSLLLDGIRSMFGHRGGAGSSSFGGLPDNRSSPWSNDRGAGNSDLARDLGSDQISNRDGERRDDRPSEADSFANTDDVYNADDSEDSDDDDFDGNDDSGDDSYDV
jgi:uncharacterized protein